MLRNNKAISKTGFSGSRRSTAMKDTSSTSVKVQSITTNPALRENKEMELNEEWSNFMLRVGEVSGLVKDMASGDKARSNAAHKRADKLLEGKVILDEDVEATVKTDRTVINKKAFKVMGNENENEMDKEVWMAEMGRDADRRAEDRKVRKEKAGTQNTMAIKAFRRGDYQKALSCYNKAIDYIKDNPMFYCDRALTNIKLKNYDKVDKDCDLALRLNEDSYKARLYRAKAHFELDSSEFDGFRKELQDLFPQHEDLTIYFLKKNDEDFEEEEEEKKED